MDVLDKMVNISVHQGLLGQLWGSTRSKFEYPLVHSLISVDPATWDNSAARESRNPLAGSAVPSGTRSSLATRPSRGGPIGYWVMLWWVLSRWIRLLSTIHGTHLFCITWCDTAVRTQYVLPVTLPVSLLTQTSFHHTFCTVHTVHTVCSPSLL